jgi:calcineurin-like phosphoesterase family protein
MSTFFTADLHLLHKKILDYCHRNFSSAEEHDETLISNYNNRISNKDDVWILGDVAFGSHQNVTKILSRLRGKKHLILGNHDIKNRIFNIKGIFSSTNLLKTIKIFGNKIVLCHYALRVWDSSHYNSWHLFGHSHGKLSPQGKSFDVGVDLHNYYPWSYDEVADRMNSLPDNTGYDTTTNTKHSEY